MLITQFVYDAFKREHVKVKALLNDLFSGKLDSMIKRNTKERKKTYFVRLDTGDFLTKYNTYTSGRAKPCIRCKHIKIMTLSR